MVTVHEHTWNFVDDDMFECECGQSTDFTGATRDTRCVICEEYHTCEERMLPDGTCECCWLASK